MEVPADPGLGPGGAKLLKAQTSACGAKLTSNLLGDAGWDVPSLLEGKRSFSQEKLNLQN